MRKTSFICICTVLTAVSVTIAGGARADDKERELLAVLESDAPAQDKALTCKRLAIYGSADAVPALGQLLSDEQLSSWARIALEAIPDPAADKALRDALGSVSGRQLIGVINSIGVRQDAEAVDGLTGHLKNEDAQVAGAAAVSLGHIGNDAARAALQDSLANGSDGIRSSVAEGCILCAEKLVDTGQLDDAAELYNQVRNADVPKQRILEATRGAIIAGQADGIPLLVEQLSSEDKDLFGLGLRTARELPGTEISKALVTALDKAPTDRQRLMMYTLAERNDATALPSILAKAQAGPNELRAVAVAVLAKAGDASCLPTLLTIATEEDGDLGQAARTALEGLTDPQVNPEIADRLSKADGQMRHVLIQLVGRRRIDAVPALIEAAEDSQPQIRAAAIAALGETVGPAHLSVLIKRVASPANPEEADVAQKALRIASVRMPDRDKCAAQLAAAMSPASGDAKRVLLETIGSVGGEKALAVVGEAAQSDQPELQDTASRLLGRWMTTDAAPVLLTLAKSKDDNKYRIRALRGYIRQVRQFSFPDDERAKMCREAFDAADRDAERLLVLQVLERYPSADTLALAVDAAKMPGLNEAASKTSLTIAKKLGGNEANVTQLLEQIGQSPVKLEIIKAEYGAGNQLKDVTAEVQKAAGKSPLLVLPSTSYNATFGGDPVPGVTKQLKIKYRINGKAGEATFAENETILLPLP